MSLGQRPATAVELRTERLLLRAWTDGDLEPFAELNADPRAMAYFPAPLNGEQSDALAMRWRASLLEDGFGMWAVELPERARFIGAIGLARPRFSAHFTPCFELSWRLLPSHWGHGYASEAALRVLRFGFDTLDLPEVVAMTTPGHQASRRVMERIGMVRDANDDFDHPRIPAGHPLRRHVLYRRASDRSHAPSR